MKLRPKITSDFPIVLVSVFLAFTIWFIAIEGDMETQNIDIPIRLISPPPNMIIELEREKATLKVHYPKSLKGTIVPSNFYLGVKVHGIRAGLSSLEPTSFNLTIYDVVKKNLSDKVKVLAIVENRSLLVKAKYYSKLVDVEAKVTGSSPKGYRCVSVSATPKQVWVTAEESVLEGFDVAVTEPIDITNRKESFIILTPLALPDNVARVDDESLIDADVVIEEEAQEYTIRNVKIAISLLQRDLDVKIEPSIADITVKCPISLIKTVSKNSFVFNPDVDEQEGGPIQYPLNPLNVKLVNSISEEIRERISIISVTPKIINVTLSKTATDEKTLE